MANWRWRIEGIKKREALKKVKEEKDKTTWKREGEEVAEGNKVIKYACLYVEHYSKFNYKHNTNYAIVHYFVRFESFFFFLFFLAE